MKGHFGNFIIVGEALSLIVREVKGSFGHWGLLKRGKETISNKFLALKAREVVEEEERKKRLFLINFSRERERESSRERVVENKQSNHVFGLCREAIVYRRCGQSGNDRTFRPTTRFAGKSGYFF